MRQENLAVKIREDKGKGAARRLRSQGMIPAVFYGKGIENINLAVNYREFVSALKKSERFMYSYVLTACSISS